ncbi:NAD-dependent epimerase/dehydratase family protein [Roseococcus sp.]|uniref:NAD-dependent epimerase/dehydratase family protein n=1 Tax=Roseococcus sp. TaxID=2109646 RepID=UPI003BAAFAA6
MKRNILILGAGGFLGRHMLVRLSAAGFGVVAGLRGKGAPATGVRHLDATDCASLRDALDGVTDIVNCVAGSPEVMVRATTALCAAAGSRRIVHLSSMAVYGNARGLVDEDAPLAGASPYARAKIESEVLLRAHVAAGGNAVMLRLGCVHGPGSEPWTLRPARLLRQGRLGELGPAGEGVCNLSALADCSSAVIACLEGRGISGAAFNISDPEPGSWNVYFRDLAGAIGLPALAPVPAWRIAAEKIAAYPLKAAEIAGRRLGLRPPEAIPPSLWSTFGQDIRLDHRRCDLALRIARQSPAEALAEAAAWLRREAAIGR